MKRKIVNPLLYLTRKKVMDSVSHLSLTVMKLYEENNRSDIFTPFDHKTENISSAVNRIDTTIASLIPLMNETKIDLVSAEEEIAELKQQEAKYQDMLTELNSKLSGLIELNQQTKSTNDRLKEAENRYEKLVDAFMNFRDQMMFFKDNAKDDNMINLLQSLYKESGRILSANGVELLISNGPFSTDTQVVKDITPTNDKDLAETVSSTVREGYRINGRLIRPQEIILFTFGNRTP
jgi:molecular chaperone GrpE (heat shock protein)